MGGGGIYAYSSTITVTNSVITGNMTTYSSGGGIRADDSTAKITGNDIISNTADCYGGGISVYRGSAEISGNHIERNVEVELKGSIYIQKTTAPSHIDANTILSNTAGILISRAAPVTVSNNIVAHSDYDGLWVFDTSLAIVNNTIAFNANGGIGASASSSTIANNIIVSNTYGIQGWAPITLTIDYNDVWGNDSNYQNVSAGTHDISADPRFVGPSANDYHLQVDSPAINKGTFTGAPSTDFDGDPRPYDCFIDIGADENTLSDYCKRVFLPLIMKNY